MKFITTSTFLLAATLLTGCGTITRGTTQVVTVNTRPADATVIIDGIGKGTTPLSVELSRKQAHHLLLEKEGYDPIVVNITKKLSGTIAGNVIFGGFIGAGIDGVTGGGFDLIPAAINETMTPVVPSL